jgi:hypothetical protein
MVADDGIVVVASVVLLLLLLLVLVFIQGTHLINDEASEHRQLTATPPLPVDGSTARVQIHPRLHVVAFVTIAVGCGGTACATARMLESVVGSFRMFWGWLA